MGAKKRLLYASPASLSIIPKLEACSQEASTGTALSKPCISGVRKTVGSIFWSVTAIIAVTL